MSALFSFLGENIMKLVSSLHWYDILDIAAVALVLYYCIKLFRQTRAIHLLRGFILIAFIYILVTALNMSTMGFLFNRLFSDIVIVIVLLFQPEFRHAIESFGRGRGFKRISIFTKESALIREEYRSAISSIVMASMNMSDNRVGALIVFEGKTPLTDIIQTGSEIDAKISVPIIENVFYPKSPLHDGAMVIRSGRICAAGCILPLTQNDLSRELGTRHRAAVGVSETSDAMVVIVSEETGAVSIAREGVLTRNVSSGELLEQLNAFLLGDENESKPKKKRRKQHEES